jgi:hypothetical protein
MYLGVMWFGDPSVGATQAPRFELLAPISVGASARVDLARVQSGPGTGTLVALKRPLPEVLASPSAANRFVDEVALTAAIQHPNVVRVLSWGTDDAGPFLAMELVEGVSLARLMKSVFETGEQFPDRLVVAIGARVASGLASAHGLRDERGVPRELVHRDLSAGNVLMSFAGDVKIADFGLAKFKDRLSHTTTELPSRPVAHIAPEELLQRRVDQRADLFALGVMLFELFAGRSPFEGADDLAISRAVIAQPTPSLAALAPRIEPGLVDLVIRLLEKDPARRPSSAAEVTAQLDEWLALRGHDREGASALARFVRRNSMRQMRWFERAVRGDTAPEPRVGTTAPTVLVEVVRPRETHPTPSSSDESTLVERRKRANAAASPPDAERRVQPTPPRSSGPSEVESMAPHLEAHPSVIRPSLDTMPTSDWDIEEVDAPTLAQRMDPALRAQLLGQRARIATPALVEAEPSTADRKLDAEPSTQSETSRGALAPSPLVEPNTTPAIAAPDLSDELEHTIDRFTMRAREHRARADRLRENERRARYEAELAERSVEGIEQAVAIVREAADLAAKGRLREALDLLDRARVQFETADPPPASQY